MIKKILVVLVLVIIAFVVVVAMKPNEYKVTRSATMAAPAETIFAQVNDFHNWGGWDPWAKLDPNAKSEFEGAASGVGAGLYWSGNKDVGEGRMTIKDSQPNELIVIQMDFMKPMPGTSQVEFTFKPEGAQTVVTWTMSGKNNFIGKACCMFMDMDKMVGGQFEKGLASIKTIVESR